ncbi:hypothetical protein GPECTOR_1g281 [Gonium pectorale]|uniref:Uncharacterized protein n=1 Tax=Gonium pectorale TaxID=33097 RepID=A0A150H2D7_GONPE|nr:hypothetical protein GPECTOR_1g281 [Gonium pectorale]|eukprot:KXZ56319.1 hypothetical protein GPECTOR_1g281 [Gonium pectorale]
MDAAEKLRARTRLALAQADARVRSATAAREAAADGDGGSSGPWTRYVFNNDAHLDEEGGRPCLSRKEDGEGGGPGEKQYNSHGLGGDLDVGELNALTFRRTGDVERRQHALRRAEAQHDDAIFGSALPPPPPLPQLAAAAMGAQRSARLSALGLRHGDDEDGPVVVDLDEDSALAASRAAAGLASESGNQRAAAQPPSSSLQAEQQQQLGETLSSAVLGQQGLSWRERALQARKKAAPG